LRRRGCGKSAKTSSVCSEICGYERCDNPVYFSPALHISAGIRWETTSWIPTSQKTAGIRWVLRAGAKKARNRRTQHSPRGLLSLMEPCEDNKCRAWGNVTKKKFSLQPPSSHVAHEDLGEKWSWRNENADLHSPQGGAGPRHGPPLGPQHSNPCAAQPRPAAAGPPPGRPLSPDKKNSDRPVQQHSQPGHWGR
jgi:hypothetical protein